MFKSIILIAILLMTGCTINGKHLDEMMEQKESVVQEDKMSAVSGEKKVEKSSSKFHFKWANKEYHDGKEDINFTVNGK